MRETWTDNYCCSKCGGDSLYDECGYIQISNHCPHCGVALFKEPTIKDIIIMKQYAEYGFEYFAENEDGSQKAYHKDVGETVSKSQYNWQALVVGEKMGYLKDKVIKIPANKKLSFLEWREKEPYWFNSEGA